jgi:hypothetical protein
MRVTRYLAGRTCAIPEILKLFTALLFCECGPNCGESKQGERQYVYVCTVQTDIIQLEKLNVYQPHDHEDTGPTKDKATAPDEARYIAPSPGSLQQYHGQEEK